MMELVICPQCKSVVSENDISKFNGGICNYCKAENDRLDANYYRPSKFKSFWRKKNEV